VPAHAEASRSQSSRSPRHRWKQWETGEKSPEIIITIGPVAPREWCFVMRRRRGMTLAQLAAESGFAARWVHRAERGVYSRRDIEPLVFWWECQLAVSSQPR